MHYPVGRYAERYVTTPFKKSVGQTYIQKVLGIQPENLLAYWPLNETSGTNADNAEGTTARDGTYTGIILNDSIGPDGGPVPSFDGVNDFVDVYSASLNSVFDPTEGTMVIWAKVANADVWTDEAVARNTFQLAAVNFSNNEIVTFSRIAADDTLKSVYAAGAVGETRETIGFAVTDWLHFAITWSVVADEVRHYINGSQIGATQTTLGTWVGALDSEGCIVGNFNITAPVFPWYGYLAHAAVWKVALMPSEVRKAATV